MNDSHYIADKKISTVTVLEGKTTPAGKEMVNVVFEDGSAEVMPLARLEATSTEEISDASKVQETLRMKVSSMLFLTLHEYGVKMGEVNGIVDATVDLCTNGYEKFRDITAGCQYHLLPLNSINEVLQKEHAKSNTAEKENNDGTSSDGSGADSADSK